MMKVVICTCCPKGCHLQVDETNNYAVTGNFCNRGAEYGKNELLHPVRTITSTVSLESDTLARLPVKTDAPVPKGQILDVIYALKQLYICCPVHTGDVLLDNICGTGANVVATRTVLY